MYIVREVFKAKPGKAKELVKMFKTCIPYFEQTSELKNSKVMTDVTGPYWTVIFESEVNDIGSFIKNLRQLSPAGTQPPQEILDAMKGYMDAVESGHREIYLLE